MGIAGLKRVLKRIMLDGGYEVRRRSAVSVDPFRLQAALLSGVSSPIIFDVGANIGMVVDHYRQLFPSATIYAFEPFRRAFEELQQRCDGHDRIVPCNLALGNRSAKAVLQVNSSSPTNSLLKTAIGAAEFWGENVLETKATVEVQIATIDEFCREHQIPAVDILKIDTQGTELDVLKGASELLSTQRVRIIYTEMIIVPSYRGQARAHELMAFLDSYGFDLYSMYDMWNRDDGRLLQLDAIFVRGREVTA